MAAREQLSWESPLLGTQVNLSSNCLSQQDSGPLTSQSRKPLRTLCPREQASKLYRGLARLFPCYHAYTERCFLPLREAELPGAEVCRSTNACDNTRCYQVSSARETIIPLPARSRDGLLSAVCAIAGVYVELQDTCVVEEVRENQRWKGAE